MKGSATTKQAKGLTLIVLFLLPVLLSFLTILSPAPAQALCILGCQARKGIERGTENLAQGLERFAEKIPTEFDVNVQVGNIGEIQNLLNSTLKGIDNLRQGASNDVRAILNESFDRTEKLALLFNSLVGEQRDKTFEQFGKLTDSIDSKLEKRTDQVFDRTQETARVVDELVGRRTDQVFDRVQETAKVADDLVGKRIDELDADIRDYLSWIEGQVKQVRHEVVEIVRAISQEVQIILPKAADQGIRVIEAGGDQGERLAKAAGEQGVRLTKASGEEVRAIIEVVDGKMRWAIRDMHDQTVSVIGYASAELQQTIEVGTKNLKEIATHISKEVQKITVVVANNRIRVIDRAGEVVIYVVHRSADFVLTLIAATCTMVFLFLTFWSWGQAILRRGLPKDPVTRGIVFSFIGATIVSAFAPSAFLIPSVRADVLISMGNAKPFFEAVPPPSLRIPAIPVVQRKEPERIVITEAPIKYLRIYGLNLDRAVLVARFGNIQLPITGITADSLEINLDPVFANSQTANLIKIEMRQGEASMLLAAISVDNSVPKPLPQPSVYPPAPQVNSELPKFPQQSSAPSQSPASPSITKQEVKDLISRWLNAKHKIFAPPFDENLVTKFTTGDLYDYIMKVSIVSLKKDNAYFKYSSQVVHSVEDLTGDRNQVKAIVTFTETGVKYVNGKVYELHTHRNRTYRNRYVLEKRNGIWKIFDYKLIE